MTRIILALTTLSMLAACETVKGAGRDLQSAGATITSEAQSVQSGM